MHKWNSININLRHMPEGINVPEYYIWNQNEAKMHILCIVCAALNVWCQLFIGVAIQTKCWENRGEQFYQLGVAFFLLKCCSSQVIIGRISEEIIQQNTHTNTSVAERHIDHYHTVEVKAYMWLIQITAAVWVTQ